MTRIADTSYLNRGASPVVRNPCFGDELSRPRVHSDYRFIRESQDGYPGHRNSTRAAEAPVAYPRWEMRKEIMGDVIERKEPRRGEITHLSSPLLIELEFAVPIVTLVEGDNGACRLLSKLPANSRQHDVFAALALVALIGQPNTRVWIVQDGVGPRRGSAQHRNAS